MLSELSSQYHVSAHLFLHLLCWVIADWRLDAIILRMPYWGHASRRRTVLDERRRWRCLFPLHTPVIIYSPLSLASAIDIAQFEIPAPGESSKIMSDKGSILNRGLTLSLTSSWIKLLYLWLPQEYWNDEGEKAQESGGFPPSHDGERRSGFYCWPAAAV